jgi:preprotein translocase SecE subunit
MAKYKADQGTYARTTSFLLLGAMVVFGADTMYVWLHSFHAADGSPGWWSRDLMGSPVPVLSEPLTPALIFAVLVGGGLIWGCHHLLNGPKVAELLIDCETEMRKCTWPSLEETWKSSVVVLLVVVFFTVVLAAVDLMLNFVAGHYVFR